MVGQNTFEEESIPMVEDVTNKNHMKCISRTGCSSPTVSLKRTEMVAMAAEDDNDEVDSETQSRLEDNPNGYQVGPELMPILRKIISKYGDIAKNCRSVLVRCRSVFLEVICEIISELEKKDFTDIEEKDLEKKIAEVEDIQDQKMDYNRLTEILEARRFGKQSGKLKEKMDYNRKSFEIAKSALEECEAQKKKLKATLERERLTRSQDESTKTSDEMKSGKSKVNRFFNSSLVEDLL